jgi:hypothetical protein
MTDAWMDSFLAMITTNLQRLWLHHSSDALARLMSWHQRETPLRRQDISFRTQQIMNHQKQFLLAAIRGSNPRDDSHFTITWRALDLHEGKNFLFGCLRISTASRVIRLMILSGYSMSNIPDFEKQ